MPSNRVNSSRSSRTAPYTRCTGYRVRAAGAVMARQFMMVLPRYSRLAAVHSAAAGLLAQRILLSSPIIFG